VAFVNGRIRELALQAGYQEDMFGIGHWDMPECRRFVELIIRECAALCDQAAQENARTFYAVTETQELGPALVAKGCQVQAEKLSRQIQQHFGVAS